MNSSIRMVVPSASDSLVALVALSASTALSTST